MVVSCVCGFVWVLHTHTHILTPTHPHMQTQSTTSYLWLVDLTSARPQRAHTPTPTPPRPSFPRTHTTTTTTNNDDDDDDTACSPMRDPSSQRPADVCDVAAVDPELFEGPAGLAILHVAWHPHSSLHFGVLTCDNTWRLYNVSDVSCAVCVCLGGGWGTNSHGYPYQ